MELRYHLKKKLKLFNVRMKIRIEFPLQILRKVLISQSHEIRINRDQMPVSNFTFSCSVNVFNIKS